MDTSAIILTQMEQGKREGYETPRGRDLATVTKNVVQQGRKWTVSGQVSAVGTTADTATILDFSVDIDKDPFKKAGFTGFTTSRITHLSISPQFVTGEPYMTVKMGADIVFETSSFSPTVVDFSTLPHGGVVDPKSGGYTGDITMVRNVVSGGSSLDYYTFIVSGELI